MLLICIQTNTSGESKTSDDQAQNRQAHQHLGRHHPPPEEAANLHLRSELRDKITALIQKNGSKQLEAAKHCRVTQPRINELLRRRVTRFSLDALVNITAHLGQRVHIELEAA